MKSKEEILNSYCTPGKAGISEISADELLKAMEEYSEQAFNAARRLNGSAYIYSTFADYTASLAVEAQPAEADRIRFMADSIMPQFLPGDPDAQALSFDMKADGIFYTVHYQKTAEGYWEFNRYAIVDCP